MSDTLDIGVLVQEIFGESEQALFEQDAQVVNYDDQETDMAGML